MSLDLDDRQRAMLHEMDVHVWWPKTGLAPFPAEPLSAAALSVAPLTKTAAASQGRPAPVSDVKKDVAASATKIQDTTNKIAYNSIRTSEKALFEPQSLPEGMATMAWPALQQAVATCQACKLCEGRKNTVFGAGQPPPHDNAAPQVDWLIVGEAPDEDEDRAGEPFVGDAGKLLDNMLKAIGQTRGRNVFTTSVIKCRPPGNRNPEVGELAQCEPYLRRQIALLQPKIILAMGRFAIQTLLQTSVPEVQKLPLGKLRGQVHRYISDTGNASDGSDTSVGRSIPVIVTYHPVALLRNLPDKAKAWADLCLAMKVLAEGAEGAVEKPFDVGATALARSGPAGHPGVSSPRG